jgi:hypothetical protein
MLEEPARALNIFSNLLTKRIRRRKPNFVTQPLEEYEFERRICCELDRVEVENMGLYCE